VEENWDSVALFVSAHECSLCSPGNVERRKSFLNTSPNVGKSTVTNKGDMSR